MDSDVTGRVGTGIADLDAVLNGGLVPGRAYTVRGEPGTGKSILGMHFLTAAPDDAALYINLEESTANVRENAASLGIDLSDVAFCDLSPESDYFRDNRSYDLFDPDEVEGEAVSDRIGEAIEATDPDRVFLDPATHLRQFAADESRFRKEMASLRRFLAERDATVLFATQPTTAHSDETLQFLTDGTIELNRGSKGRTVEVTKFRGSGYRGGEHTLEISGEGMRVYPKLAPGDHDRTFKPDPISSGVPELDAMLSGGLERGTVSVISGSPGVGKTTTAAHFAAEAAARGERAALYLFEEAAETFRHRSRSIGLPVEDREADGTLETEEVEPLALSPDVFAANVRTAVEERDVEVVVIDGISGYRMSILGDETGLLRELHALCRYLRNMGVTVVLVDDIDSVTGEFQPTSRRISYLADNIVFLRYIEYQGEIRKAVGVLKKRVSDFEPTLRRFRITGDGLAIGEPLTGLRGILTGTPEWTDDDGS
ncbi:ATPase domain-containing protein [Halostella litorea]|uniref:ATPase domain-containing protein n=1 Tax=Halostella litorea TaxID=2528831 RepID=UPI001092E108|nr:ATPase domain-containing protein [Halostella litorea]